MNVALPSFSALGARLFNKSFEGYSLTEEGETLLDATGSVQEMLLKAERKVAQRETAAGLLLRLH